MNNVEDGDNQRICEVYDRDNGEDEENQNNRRICGDKAGKRDITKEMNMRKKMATATESVKTSLTKETAKFMMVVMVRMRRKMTTATRLTKDFFERRKQR